MRLHNTTHLDTDRLKGMILAAIDGWPRGGLDVRVRYSRGAEFSGTCYYRTARININLGRTNVYPYLVRAGIARAWSNRRSWGREIYSVPVADAYQLALFIFLHEFYHWLVKKARRNTRQKEARCDRFATRVLVNHYGAVVRDSSDRPVPREAWDFQDLEGFVSAARGPREQQRPMAATRSRPPAPVVRPPGVIGLFRQLLLFDLG